MKDRDFDAISLGLVTPTNPITGMIRYVRASNKFQEFDGAVWNDKNISISGGGTGAGTAADARTNLGLGSIATQASSAINITGGTISGLSSFQVAGSITVGGQLIVGSTPVTLTNAAGKIPALTIDYFASLAFDAINLTGGPYPALSGALITALNASALASGTVPTARLGSGTANVNTVLRGDQTWGPLDMILSIQTLDIIATGDTDVTLGTTLTDYTKAFASFIGTIATSGGTTEAKISSNTNFRIRNVVNMKGTVYIIEFR